MLNLVFFRHSKKEQTDSNLRGGGRGTGGEGRRVVRNMHKGHMDKAKGGKDRGWEVWMAGVRG